MGVSPARVSGNHKVHVGGVLDGVLVDCVDGYTIICRELAHPLDDPEVIPAY